MTSSTTGLVAVVVFSLGNRVASQNNELLSLFLVLDTAVVYE
jgi:hypothetical protein